MILNTKECLPHNASAIYFRLWNQTHITDIENETVQRARDDGLEKPDRPTDTKRQNGYTILGK